MKPYRGIIRIVCNRKTGCLRNLKVNVQAGCMDCHEARTEVLDLDGVIIYEYVSPPERTGERVRPTKPKTTKTEV